MPRYYCDYCDTYLTHDSPSVRKQHNAGYKHKANVRLYYQKFEEQQTQSLVDQRIKEHLGQHLGQAAAYGQVGAAYNQHLMAQRPRLPVLPTPGMPQMPGGAQMVPGMRPPVLPRPMPGAPGGYGSAPPMMPMMAPPGAPGMPGQLNVPMRPPTMNPPPTVAGSTAPNASVGVPSMAPPPMYQSNQTPPTSGGYDGFNPNTQPPDSSQ
ncbi:hypothetical protein PRUPE_8G251800 [Prunus persica]|uniref:U1 small nuclear ribonucleoprotein C n=1 Tax=Prunus persica TaxID=3760 RepID=A0A251N367_PRUPE|nr:U1 small nuclear ribonucleoprotein C [Prunus persica]ONH93776.1 hypothetical protein PRUPE_8G251800 [Prunus persica]ONH93777.1 hypothetical protein PRUPE_8G251800 [Prunus persica]